MSSSHGFGQSLCLGVSPCQRRGWMWCLLTVVWFSCLVVLPSRAPAIQDPPPAPKDGILPTDRAWEYQHYRVRVWLCTDGSPIATSVAHWLPDQLVQRAEVLDGSAWEVFAEHAPARWNYRCMDGVRDVNQLREVAATAEAAFDDKLVLVCLSEAGTGLKADVREFDVLTRQWSALIQRDLDALAHADAVVFEAMRIAFMPLARIDHVTESNHVTLRARAINSCWRVRRNEDGEWEAETNTASPAWIRPDDKLLPVLRRTDKRNALDSLDPVPFTFITVSSTKPPGMAEIDPEFTEEENVAGQESYVQELAGSMATFYGTIHQSLRAVLMGRASKRLQKLALVIRPPSGTTRLYLVSNDKERLPMEGVEVYSRPLYADESAPSEFLGKTDWRGVIDIPPATEGLRIVLLKRGARGLRRLPMMPGLYPELTAEVDNDEAALYAQGVAYGMLSEITALVTERLYLERLITNALDGGRLDAAQRWLTRYEELPTGQKLRARMTDDQVRLSVRSKNQRERDFIEKLFTRLRLDMDKYVQESRDLEFRQKMQALRSGNPSSPQ